MTALRKVLVVDDDPVVGKSFDRVLTKKGYVVVTAESGEEALRKLAAEEYDVVYTDIKMPGMSGLEVAERVKAKRPWTPVVIITGYGTAESEARAEKAGVREFLHKPLSPDMIEGSARKALEAAPVPVEVTAIPAEAAPAPKESLLKNILLFLLSPFFGLAYIVLFPFVAGAMMAWVAAGAIGKQDALRNIGRIMGHAGMLAAAPLIGLGFIIAFPVIGAALLAWYAGAALVERSAKATWTGCEPGL
jgi:CheY-like chemotaxis protein